MRNSFFFCYVFFCLISTKFLGLTQNISRRQRIHSEFSFFFVILCMPFKPQNSKLNVCSVKVSNSFVEALHLNVLWVHFMFLNAKKKFPFFTLSHPFCVIQFEKWDLAVIKNIRNDAVRFEAEAERESEKKSEKK